MAFGDPAEQVSRWWDLAALQNLYDAFIARFSPTAARAAEAGKNTTPARDAFVDYVHVLTAWRRFPYLDPRLPDTLLPPIWSGTTAADLFFQLRHTLEGPAHECARSLLTGS